jgi:REP-associated tyrosine transposase
MARLLRIEFPGTIYHVTARGNAREAIYLDDEDRKQFLETYSEVASGFNWLCHSYCMMTNHYHWVMETPEGN